MSDQIGDLIKSVKAQDFQAFARLLTVLERGGPEVLAQYDELLSPPQCSFRIGITGPPGAGKSTLIGQLISEFRQRQLSVGVVAVDPSSPFSHGAILGDRIRYSEHFNDPKVFIRSLGSRGSLGGLSASAYLMLRAYDLFGFDVVLIETVGVGQTELEVMHVADLVSVVLVPESGDSVQAMKAGLLEIADLFVVNKADRPGAESLVRELQASVELGTQVGQGKSAEVISTVATQGQGVKDLADKFLASQADGSFKSNRNSVERLRWEARSLLQMQLHNQIDQKVANIQSVTDLKNLFSPEG